MGEREKRILTRLLALATRGEPGERENAERALDKACAKYGVSRADLEAAHNGLRLVTVRYHGDLEYRLALQILSMVTDANEITTLHYPRVRTWFQVELPVAAAVEFETIYTTYQSAWHEEQKSLYLAFISRNGIFPASAETDSTEPTPEERRRWKKAARMGAGVDVVPVRKQIGGE